MIKIKQNFIFLSGLSFFLLFMGVGFGQELVSIPEGGVPGQIDELQGGKRIYFEGGVFVDWLGTQLTLVDSHQNHLAVALDATVQKQTAREKLGEQVMETDLGGNLKKTAPLAYKNPKVREIKLPQGGDPLKTSGVQITKSLQEKTTEGGVVSTTEYADGSKSVSYLLKTPYLKEESSFSKTHVLIWRNIEGEVQGLKFKKTQWEDGSVIREYSQAEGIVSAVFDEQRKTYTFSFLNPKREVVGEFSCTGGLCEE